MKLVGERRALASLVLVFWFFNYLLNGFMGPGPTAPLMFGLAGVYGLAFLGVVAGYFWARWYAVGVSLFGVIIGVVAWWKIGLDEIVMILGGSHLFVTLMLWGNSMSAIFDGRSEWRERFHMDDSAVHRLGRSVIRAGVLSPVVLAWGLAPKQSGAALAVVAVASLGVAAVMRLRTWGVLALAGASALTLTLSTHAVALDGAATLFVSPLLVAALLLAAAAPFARPMARYLLGRPAV